MTKEEISAFLKAQKKESDQSIADNLKIKQERVNEFLNAKYNYRIDTLLKFLNYFGFKIKLVIKKSSDCV